MAVQIVHQLSGLSRRIAREAWSAKELPARDVLLRIASTSVISPRVSHDISLFIIKKSPRFRPRKSTRELIVVVRPPRACRCSPPIGSTFLGR